MNGKRKSWPRVAVATVVCAVLLFSPFPSTTAPAFRIQVLDESGRPIQGLRVRQEWAYFRIDNAPWADDRTTDQQGYVTFPYRTTWASLASRILGGIGYALERYGPSVFVLACDEDHLQEAKLFWDGNKFWNRRDVEASRIFAKPVRECSMM